jgi:hypothetical protein
MNSEALAELVLRQINAYQYQPPSSGLIGNPFPPEKVSGYIALLRQALVKPYPQRFVLEEVAEQVHREPPECADYWVVAEADEYLEWYDPQTGDFGLALRSQTGLPVSIGVRGDVVGVFIAM